MSDNQSFDKPAEVPMTQPAPVARNTPTAANPYPQQQPIVIERSGGRGAATGALVLSVLALGASGYLWVEGRNVLKQQETIVQNALQDAALGETDNAHSLKLALQQQEKLNQSVMALSKDQNEDHQHLANMQRSYNELLKGRVNWLVDEIEVTLNVASQQLLLSGNVPVAISALNTIEQRLKRFDQPELIAIKKAIADDLSDLRAQGGNYLDVSSTSLKVDSLEKGVASLPLVVDSTLQPANNESVPTANDADFWTRTWDKTVGMVKGMVEIRKLESNDAMLLSPEQIYFVRANLRLRLLDARLALLQHNNEIYKKNLDEAKRTVEQYFDTQAPTTQEWLKTLSELNNQQLQIVSDTALSRSQTAVRNYQTQAETEKQPISMREIEARSDVILPSISGNSSANNAANSVDTAKAASAPVAEKVQAASEVKAADKPVEKSVEKAAEKPAEQSEVKAASGGSSEMAAALAGATGMSAAKALADKLSANKAASEASAAKTTNENKSESKSDKDKSDNKSSDKSSDKANTKPKTSDSKKADEKKSESKKADSVGKSNP